MERLPELRESDAPPAVRAIYDDIRRASGIPQVNLIFRHLGAAPEVLDWAWQTVGPLYRDGRVARAAARLGTTLPLPPQPPVWEAAEPRDAPAIRAVLAFYERGNSANLVGLTALLKLAEGEGAGETASLPEGPPQTPGSTAPVPPLPRMDAVPPDLLALVEDLAERQGSTAFGVLPSLWLHLTLWPAAIRRAHATIGPLIGTAEWETALAALTAEADALAGDLARAAQAAGPAPDGAAERLATVRRFVTTVIPQMLLAGRVLAGRGAG